MLVNVRLLYHSAPGSEQIPKLIMNEGRTSYQELFNSQRRFDPAFIDARIYSRKFFIEKVGG